MGGGGGAGGEKKQKQKQQQRVGEPGRALPLAAALRAVTSGPGRSWL